jgi:hypothetical protein
MEEEKNSRDPSDYRQSQSFKQNYAGTLVAKRMHTDQNSDSQDPQSQQSEREPFPVELKTVIEWINRLNHNAITSVFTVGIFLATAIYAVVATLQWCAMRDSNKINRDALEGVQRPFVTFSPKMSVGTKFDPRTGHIAAFFPQVPINNSGNTATRNLKDHVSVYPSKDELPQTFTFPDIGRAPESIDIGPHDSITYYAASFGINDARAAQSGTGHVYIYGWATYNDGFRNTSPHITQFCYELKVDDSVDISDPKWIQSPYNIGSFQMCPSALDHNCTDEECRTQK